MFINLCTNIHVTFGTGYLRHKTPVCPFAQHERLSYIHRHMYMNIYIKGKRYWDMPYIYIYIYVFIYHIYIYMNILVRAGFLPAGTWMRCIGHAMECQITCNGIRYAGACHGINHGQGKCHGMPEAWHQ